jgi:hypothetical protein
MILLIVSDSILHICLHIFYNYVCVFLSHIYICVCVRFQPWREEDTFVSEFAGHVLPPSIFRNFGAPREGNWMGRLSKLQGIYGREENERERGPRSWHLLKSLPIGSMYAIYGNIYHILPSIYPKC